MLVSVARVKAFLGLSTVDHDDLLADIVAGICAQADDFVGRPLELHTVTSELHFTSGEQTAIRLRHWPAQEITTVVEGTTTLTAAQYQLEPSADPRVGPRILSRLSSASSLKLWEAGSVFVTYEAGFVQEALPAGLALALSKQAAAVWRETVPGGDRLGKASESPEVGSTIQFVDMAASTERVLSRYRGFGSLP